ncbi:hypothetical protein [Hydrogenimonas sp.]
MLRLTNDFTITAIKRHKRHPLFWKNREMTYYFRYKHYRLFLHVEIEPVGITEEDNIVISSFGYSLDIDRWNEKEKKWESLSDFDPEDGQSTRKYLDDSRARGIVFAFVKRYVDKFLHLNRPAIIIRGAMNDEKIASRRYKELDDIFQKYYFKKVYDVQNHETLYSLCGNYGEKGNKEIWVYVKKAWYFDQVHRVLPVE